MLYVILLRVFEGTGSRNFFVHCPDRFFRYEHQETLNQKFP